uniref:Hyccin n=1 Tax=Echinostoma caproni TaxID=27848 RepID=A0A183A337_9TREM
LIHVYNQAPSAAFMDPVVYSKLQAYQYRLLPVLYPETRRLASMVTLGPRILSAHLAASRHQNRCVGKTIPVATSADTHPRGEVRGTMQTITEVTELNETNRSAIRNSLSSTAIADGGGNGVLASAIPPVYSGSSISSVEPAASDRLLTVVRDEEHLGEDSVSKVQSDITPEVQDKQLKSTDVDENDSQCEQKNKIADVGEFK